MTFDSTSLPTSTWRTLLGRRRLQVAAIACALWTALMGLAWTSPWWELLLRTVTGTLAALLAFGLLERWPARLPRWIARWALQVLAVALVIPATMAVFWIAATAPGAPPFWEVGERLMGFSMLSLSAVLVAPWIATAALLRQRDDLVRAQAIAFERERAELEHAARDARHRLLQAQVQPHFLFNTLANVRELVESGSAQAPAVLDHLIAYLRAAVPRLHEPVTTLGQELDLVAAYLALMRMRMPDRLDYGLHVDPGMREVPCPPMTLLTLVENAVRHGIDPAEDGGRIDVHVRQLAQRCRVEVIDSGVGLQASSRGLGTGLSSLRERLQQCFGSQASLALSPVLPRGMLAAVEWPIMAVP